MILLLDFQARLIRIFEETYQFIQEMDFDHSYSFIYSKRPGTPASELADDTPEEVKKSV